MADVNGVGGNQQGQVYGKMNISSETLEKLKDLKPESNGKKLSDLLAQGNVSGKIDIPPELLEKINEIFKNNKINKTVNELSDMLTAGNGFGKTDISPETLAEINKLVVKYNEKLRNAYIKHALGFDLRAPEEELAKLTPQERKEYDDLFNYANSKSCGMEPAKDAKIKEWNEKHPNCKIKSQYDDVNILKCYNHKV